MRTIFSQYYLEGQSAQMISIQLHFSVATIKAYLRKGRTLLRQLHDGSSQQNISEVESTRTYQRRKKISDEQLCYLTKLPSHYRTVLELAYIQRLSDKQIATQLKCPLGIVKVQIKRGITLLNGFYT